MVQINTFRLKKQEIKFFSLFVLFGLLIFFMTACTSGPINPGPGIPDKQGELLPKPDPILPLPKQEDKDKTPTKVDRHVFQAYITATDKNRLVFNEVQVLQSHKKKDIEEYQIDHSLFHNGVYVLDMDETWLPFSISPDTEIYLKYFGSTWASAVEHQLVSKEELLEEIYNSDPRHYSELLVEMTFEDGNLTKLYQLDLQKLWADSLAYDHKVQEAFAGIYNNGSQFVKFHDQVFYLKYEPQSFDKTSIWGNRHLTDDVLAYMTMIDENGDERELFPVNSASDFYLIDSNIYDGPFIYMAMLDPIGNRDYEDGDYEGDHPDIQGESGLGDSSYLVYKLSDTGEVAMEFYGHSIVALDAPRGAIITHNIFSDEIRFQDMGNAHDMGSAFGIPLYYDMNQGTIYYHNLDADDLEGMEDYFSVWLASPPSDYKDLLVTINPRDLQKTGIIRDSLAGISVTNLIPAGDYVWMTLLISEGEAPEIYNQELVIKVERYPEDPSNNFVLIHDAPEIYYHGFEEAYYDSYSHFSQQNSHGSYAYFARDYPLAPHGLLYSYEMEQLGYDSFFNYGDHDFHHVEEVYYVDEDIYFTLVSGPYNEEASLGWRSAYDRALTEIYRKDPYNGVFYLVYSYEQ